MRKTLILTLFLFVNSLFGYTYSELLKEIADEGNPEVIISEISLSLPKILTKEGRRLALIHRASIYQMIGRNDLAAEDYRAAAYITYPVDYVSLLHSLENRFILGDLSIGEEINLVTLNTVGTYNIRAHLLQGRLIASQRGTQSAIQYMETQKLKNTSIALPSSWYLFMQTLYQTAGDKEKQDSLRYEWHTFYGDSPEFALLEGNSTVLALPTPELLDFTSDRDWVDNAGYIVQTGSFWKKEDAQKQVRTLVSYGYAPVIKEEGRSYKVLLETPRDPHVLIDKLTNIGIRSFHYKK